MRRKLREVVPPPVRVNEIREVVIDAEGSEGDGIAHVEGFAVVVKEKGLRISDTVMVRIDRIFTKDGKGCAFASLIKDKKEGEAYGVGTSEGAAVNDDA
jgi:predicted RNA-binding protein with TRAM domain